VFFALITLGLTFYIFIVRFNTEKAQQRKDWFHRLVIEPKLDDLFHFFHEVENELNTIEAQLDQVLPEFEEKVNSNNDINNAIYEFRRSFIDFLEPIDETLSSSIQNKLTNFQDMVAQKLFIEQFNAEAVQQLNNAFRNIKNEIIKELYQWNK
jgi:capsule polysaccharide export protein KpsE/RkpR